LLASLLLALLLGVTGRLAFSLAPTPAPSANGPDGGSLSQRGHLGGPVQTLFASNGTLFAGIGPELAALDLTDPSQPARQDYHLYGENLTSLTIVGDYAYLTNGNFHIAGIADPQNLTSVGSVNIPGTALDVAVAADRAYVVSSNFAAPYGHLRIFDVLTPTAPLELGSLSFIAEARAVAITGTHAIVANDIVGLSIVDVANPATPQLRRTFATNGQAYDIAIKGNYAFVATASCAVNCAGGLQVIDLADPVNPTDVFFSPLPSQPTRLTIQADLLLLANGNGGLAQFDISDPTAPVNLGLTALGAKAVAVAASGNDAFVATGASGLQHLTLTPTTLDGGLPNLANALAAAFLDDYAYIGDGAGLFVVDTSTVEAPVIVRQIATAGWVYDIAFAAGYAYVAIDEAGLLIFDVSNPADPQFVTSLDTPGSVQAILVAGDYAYLADGATGLRVLDVSDPTQPAELTVIDTAGLARGLALDGATLYLADFDRGLRIFDLSDPADPAEIGLYNTPGEARAVAAAGNYAYVADGFNGLRIIDVSQPANPAEVGSFSNFRYAHDLQLSGSYVYLANDSGGLQLFDVANPAQPNLLDTKNSAGLAWGVAIDPGRRLIGLADRYGGFYLYRQDGISLKGTVVQANGQGFAGITINSSAGGSAVSGAGGLFIFNEPALGPQILTPTGAGYSFLPASQTVAVPTGLANIQFVVLPEPVQANISNGGGSLSYTATNGVTTTLTVPPGAVSSAVTLVLTPTVVLPPAGHAFAGHAFVLAAYQGGSELPNFSFDLPVSITLNYGDDDLGNIGHESSLALYWTTSQTWSLAGASCSPAASSVLLTDQNQLQTAFCRTGRFGLFGDLSQRFLPIILRP
ncbi:MAG: hypothetical protein KDE09_19730, partial [Anaerolineales bacterium]|nr:hypothetical protein [Anaerolineales bacterium]